MSDPEPPSADVLQFVGRGVAAQNGVDAALAGAMVGLVKQQLLAALASTGPTSAAHVRQALHELEALKRSLGDHFERLGVRPRSTT